MEHSTVYGNNIKWSGSLKQQNMKTVKSKYLKLYIYSSTVWILSKYTKLQSIPGLLDVEFLKMASPCWCVHV